jgi:hypothetical protein
VFSVLVVYLNMGRGLNLYGLSKLLLSIQSGVGKNIQKLN